MPSLSRVPLALLLGAALSPMVARAEAPSFGGQVLGSFPFGDLGQAVDSKPGLGAGFHATFDLGGAHRLRPRFDAVFFPEGTRDEVRTKAQDLSLGADYLYYLSAKPQGFYVTAGLGLHRWTVDTAAPARDPMPAVSESQTSYRFGYALGLGYAFTPTLGAELRYVGSHYANQTAWDPTANTLQAGLTFRF